MPKRRTFVRLEDPPHGGTSFVVFGTEAADDDQLQGAKFGMRGAEQRLPFDCVLTGRVHRLGHVAPLETDRLPEMQAPVLEATGYDRRQLILILSPDQVW